MHDLALLQREDLFVHVCVCLTVCWFVCLFVSFSRFIVNRKHEPIQSTSKLQNKTCFQKLRGLLVTVIFKNWDHNSLTYMSLLRWGCPTPSVGERNNLSELVLLFMNIIIIVMRNVQKVIFYIGNYLQKIIIYVFILYISLVQLHSLHTAANFHARC